MNLSAYLSHSPTPLSQWEITRKDGKPKATRKPRLSRIKMEEALVEAIGNEVMDTLQVAEALNINNRVAMNRLSRAEDKNLVRRLGYRTDWKGGCGRPPVLWEVCK